MPYWRLFYHFVWGTKHGEPLIDGAFEESLHRAIAAKVNDLEGIAHAVGGIETHVHLVVSVPPKTALSTFIGQVKGNTSHFVNHEIRPGYAFGWQDEYGVVSFGERHLGWVVAYAHNQAEHHAQGTIQRRLEQVTGS
jgi:putative transposase